MGEGKSLQLQIRLTVVEKAAIQQAAARSGMDMSSWVLARLFPVPQRRFRELTESLSMDPERRRYVLAELNDFLAGLGPAELGQAVSEPPRLEPYAANYVAAMIETAAHDLGILPPAWTAAIAPLPEPVFCTPLPGLRLHLLVNSPPAFRRRNIFIDATVGDRV